jgi:hypothetical protein
MPVDAPAARPVWARKKASAFRCPKSLVNGETAQWLEQFAVWRRLGYPDVVRLAARDVDAMLALEEEFLTEVIRGHE